MSNIEKIRQEIKRRMEELEKGKYINIDAKTCRQSELKYLERFIDSLPEEKPSDDLKEAADEYADKHGFRVPYDGSNNYYDDVDVKASKEGFLAGAEWASPRWISVNEKLPPEDEEVIVLTNEANGHTLPIACHLCFAHIVSDKTMFVDYDGWNIPQVKYWMPCPELPEK